MRCEGLRRSLRTLLGAALLGGCASWAAVPKPIVLGPRVVEPLPLEIASFAGTQWFDWDRSDRSISTTHDASCRTTDVLPDALRTAWRTLNRFGTSEVKWTMACKATGTTRALAEVSDGRLGRYPEPTLVGPATAIHAAATIRYVDERTRLHLPIDRFVEFNRALQAYSGDPPGFRSLWPFVVPARLHAGCSAIAEVYDYDPVSHIDMSAMFCLDEEGHVGDVLLGPIQRCHASVAAILDLDADGTDEVVVRGCGLELVILDWDPASQRIVERISGRALEKIAGTPVGWRLPPSRVTTGGKRRRR